MGRKPLWVDLNPKAITTFELFGYINPATREWKDGQYIYTTCSKLLLHTCSLDAGLFSSLMRDLSEKTTDSPKWIVLDGDIDPMWIESLNTVMDDNKVSQTTLYKIFNPPPPPVLKAGRIQCPPLVYMYCMSCMSW